MSGQVRMCRIHTDGPPHEKCSSCKFDLPKYCAECGKPLVDVFVGRIGWPLLRFCTKTCCKVHDRDLTGGWADGARGTFSA
jgi:predicted amidophosphoribosyltransferase